MDSIEKKIAYYSDEIMRYLEALPEDDRYGFLLSALETSIKNETDKGFLVVIAAHLQELSEDALERSGVEIISPGNKTIN
jgi:hypothetical protein